MPRDSASPACETNSSRRAPKPSIISSSLGPTSAATRSTATGACSFASALISPATFPLSTNASTGAASVSTPPTSVLTNRKIVEPSAPSANTDASYFSVSILISTLVSDGPSSPVTARATSRMFSLATWMISSASRSSSAAISSPSASVHAFHVSWTKNDR